MCKSNRFVRIIIFMVIYCYYYYYYYINRIPSWFNSQYKCGRRSTVCSSDSVTILSSLILNKFAPILVISLIDLEMAFWGRRTARSWCIEVELSNASHFCGATLCIARPMRSCGVRLSGCLSDAFMYCIKTSEHMLKLFIPFGSAIILDFPHQTIWQNSNT